MNRTKLIVVIASVAFIVLVGGWIIFFAANKKPTPSPQPSTFIMPSFAPVPSKQATQPVFEMLSDHWAMNPLAGANNVVSFFDKTDGFLKNISLVLGTKQETKISETVFDATSTQALWWSPDKQSVLVQFDQYGTKRFSVFDYRQNITYTLPAWIEAATWSPDGKQLAVYHTNDNTQEHYLATMTRTATKETKLASIVFSDPVILWPSADTIIAYQKPAPRASIVTPFTYSLTTRKLSSATLVAQEGPSTLFGVDILPSPSNKYQLFSTTDQNNRNIRLYVRDVKNQGVNIVPFYTLVQKCAWGSAETLYCAFSQEFQATQLATPFDYWKGLISTNDSFGRLNVKTGEWKVYATDTGYDAMDVSVNPDESFLVFVNRNDLSLYKMKL